VFRPVVRLASETFETSLHLLSGNLVAAESTDDEHEGQTSHGNSRENADSEITEIVGVLHWYDFLSRPQALKISCPALTILSGRLRRRKPLRFLLSWRLALSSRDLLRPNIACPFRPQPRIRLLGKNKRHKSLLHP
jgi:hypothetical protein